MRVLIEGSGQPGSLAAMARPSGLPGQGLSRSQAVLCMDHWAQDKEWCPSSCCSVHSGVQHSLGTEYLL